MKKDQETVVELPLDKIHDSPFQPRTEYDMDLLLGLAESMVPPHGRVLSPIRVRPSPKHKGEWETIFGHQRRRAAQMAQLTTIPALVTDWSDEQVKYAQIVENLQRKGVSPIEEADALHELKTTHGASIEQLMERSGMKRSYVYNRLRLATAHSDVREAVLQGDMDAELAQEVARLPKPLQPGALKAVQFMSVRGGIAELRQKFQYKLHAAPFDVLDIKLVPDAGACDACTKRSDAEPVLLEECGPNVCMDSACYRNKAQAALEAEEAAAQQRLAQERATAPAATTAGESTQTTWEDTFGKAAPAAQRSQPTAGAATGGTDDEDDDSPAEATPPAELALKDPHFRNVLPAVLGVIRQAQRTTDDLRWLLRREIELGDRCFSQPVLNAMGWDAEFEDLEGPDRRNLAMHKIATGSADLLGQLLVMEAAANDALGNVLAQEFRRDLCTRYAVNAVAEAGLEPKADAGPQMSLLEPPAAQAGGKAIRYRDAATGATWSGKGLKPAWLKAALEQGKKLADFEVTA